MRYSKAKGLVDCGKASDGIPYDIIVSANEKTFAASSYTWSGPNESLNVEGYDTETCKKRWSKPGTAIKFLANGQLVIKNGGSVSFVDIQTGREKRSINLEGFFD